MTHNYNHYHEIDRDQKTNVHLADIIDSIKVNGWKGLPLLANGDQLFNGCHRATACEILGVTPEIHQMEITCTWGDSDYTDGLLTDLCEARRSDSVLSALVALMTYGYVDQYSVDIMRAECDGETK